MDWLKKVWAWLGGLRDYMRTFEPAMLRGVWVAIVGLLAALGITLAPGIEDKVNAILGVIIAIVAILQAYWTRGAVTPAGVAENAVAAAAYSPAPPPVIPETPDLGEVQDDEVNDPEVTL